MSDIQRLHHVGHLVTDMEAALALYRRLGFQLAPPAYPMLPPHAGAAPRPFGAVNTHAELRGNFVELATCVTGTSRIPRDALLVPLDAPPESLPQLHAAIERSAANLATCLQRFEGLHILVLQCANVDAVAQRLREAGVHHGGVHAVRRGPQAIRFLELDTGDGSGLLPEGRIGMAEPLAADPGVHPNGALELVESILCVGDADLAEFERHYERILGRPAQKDGPARVFALDGARLTLLAARDLAAVLPGERPPALPAFVAYTVTVRDLGETRRFLAGNGFLPLSRREEIFVPASAALGAAVIFRQR